MALVSANNEHTPGLRSSKSGSLVVPHKQWVAYPEGSKWLPVIQEFQTLIETDEEIHYGFTQMFKQASGLNGATDYKEMLQNINDEIQQAPRYEGIEFVGCSIYRILDKVMCTPAGLATLANPLVNDQFRRIFDVWAVFLSSPQSRSALTSDEGGWFSSTARADMPTSFDTFLSNQDAPYGGFKSWDDYFTRQLRPGDRPVEDLEDNSVINNPCESTVYYVTCDIKERACFWLKEQPYSLCDMFHDDPFTNRFVGGTILQCSLHAFSYNRWHSPVNGRVVKTRVIHGVCFSQAPQSPNSPQMNPITSQRFLTAVSTRALVFIESDNPHIGLMCFMAVGMVGASTCDIRVKLGDRVTKGQEIGMFHFGCSTYCMLFRPSVKVTFSHTIGDSVPVNSTIATVSV